MTITCYFCKKDGHTVYQCPTCPPCGHCGKKGHSTYKCAAAPKTAPKTVAPKPAPKTVAPKPAPKPPIAVAMEVRWTVAKAVTIEPINLDDLPEPEPFGYLNWWDEMENDYSYLA